MPGRRTSAPPRTVPGYGPGRGLGGATGNYNFTQGHGTTATGGYPTTGGYAAGSRVDGYAPNYSYARAQLARERAARQHLQELATTAARNRTYLQQVVERGGFAGNTEMVAHLLSGKVHGQPDRRPASDEGVTAMADQLRSALDESRKRRFNPPGVHTKRHVGGFENFMNLWERGSDASAAASSSMAFGSGPRLNTGAGGGIMPTPGIPGISGTQMLATLGAPQEQIAQAYYAWQRARRMGGSWQEQQQAAVAGLPGLGGFAPGGSLARTAVEQTNSWEERFALTEQGDLSSFGEYLLGDADLPDWVPLFGGADLSGAADFAFQLASDPLTYSPVITSRFGNVGGVAGRAGLRSAARAASMSEDATRFATALGRLNATLRPAAVLGESLGDDFSRTALRELVGTASAAGRRAFLESPRGRALIEALDEVLAKPHNHSGRALQRALEHGGSTIPFATAQEAADAIGRAGGGLGRGGARSILTEAFVEGVYQPQVTLRRQLSVLMGNSEAIAARGLPVILGPKTVKVSSALRRFLELGRGGALQSMLPSSGSPRYILQQIEDASARHTAEATGPDFFDAHIAPHVEELDVQQRIDRIFGIIEGEDILNGKLDAGDIGGMRAVVASELARLNELAHVVASGVDDAWEVADDLIDGIRNIEVTIAMLRGDGGDMAQLQARHLLRLAYNPKETRLTGYMAEAMARVGLADDAIPTKRNPISPTRPGLGRAVKPLERREATARWAQGRMNGALRRLRQWMRENPGLDPIDSPFAEEVGQWQVRLKNAVDDVTNYHSEVMAQKAEQWELRLASMADEATLRLTGYGPEGFPASQTNLAILKARIDGLSTYTRVYVEAELARLLHAGADDLYPVLRWVDLLYAQPELAEQFDFIAKGEIWRAESHRIAQAAIPEMQQEAVDLLSGAFLGSIRNPVRRGFSSLLLSIDQSVAPPFIPFMKGANPSVAIGNRVEAGARWLDSLGFGPFEREWFSNALASAATEAQVVKLVKGAITTFARSSGLDDDAVRRLLGHYDELFGRGLKGDLTVMSAQRGFNRSSSKAIKQIFDSELPDDFDSEGFIRSLQLRYGRNVPGATVSQRVAFITNLMEEIPLLDPDTLRRMVREEILRSRPGLQPLRRTRSGIGRALDYEWRGSTLRGALGTGHRLWKLSVVTNLPAVGAGFVGGLVGADELEDDGDASMSDRLHWALVGGAIGALGGVRYIGRVAGIEERFIRMSVAQGFLPDTWIPLYARWRNTHGILRPFRLVDELHQLPMEDVASHALRTYGSQWVVLDASNPRFIDGWFRVVNFQVNPEFDPVTRLLLQGRVGASGITPDDARSLIHEFFDTADGRTYWTRIQYGTDAPKTVDALIDLQMERLDRFLPSDDLVRLRLEAMNDVMGKGVDRRVLKEFLQQGEAPRTIHALESWKIPRSGAELMQTIKQVPARLVLERPTAKMNREPMARAAYRRHFNRLVRGGMNPDVAQTVAEEATVRFVNTVMFRIADESRFAAQVDLFAPFQQPREEMLRVYGRLLVSNPARVARLTRLGALAFNNGKESGVFYEDQYGDWRMRVPGSLWLSRAIGGNPFAPVAPMSGDELLGWPGNEDEVGRDIAWDFRLSDTLFFLQSGGQIDVNGLGGADILNFGMSLAPHPGGPYWAAITRLALNAFPGFHERILNSDGIDRWVYDQLFPYGARGTLGRSEASRLWMGMTGSTPFWELASEFEQENELRKVQQMIYEQMYWEYRRNGGLDPDWTPDIDDVVSASMAFFRIQATIGSIVPAPIRAIVPQREWYDRIRAQYTNGRGDFVDGGYERMVTDYPETAIYMASSSEWVGPEGEGDMDLWRHGVGDPNDSFDEYSSHYLQRLSLSAFDEVVQDAHRTRRLWNEWNDIIANPHNIERMQDLIAFREENPDFDTEQGYFKTRDLARILATSTPQNRERLLNEWRLTYNVSFAAYRRLLPEARNFHVNPWTEARYPEEVHNDVRLAVRNGANREWYVAQLPAAEQVSYWQYQQAQIQYFDHGAYDDAADPQAVLDRWNFYKSQINAVYSANPQLFTGFGRQNAIEERISEWRGDYRNAVSSLYDRIYNELIPARDQAAASGQWSTRSALQDQISGMFDFVRALRAKQYQELPDLEMFQRDMQAMLGHSSNWERHLNNPDLLRKWQSKFAEGNVPFLPSNEEASYLAMTDDVRSAYVADLVNQLAVPPGEYDFMVGDRRIGKLFWDWLTPFQKDLLRRNAPAEQVEQWQMEDPDADYSSGSGGGYYGYRGGGGGGYGGGSSELSWAYSLFEQYNQRGGMAQPAAYAQYLELPNDPALREDFLDRHPEVREYVSLGPMANMPPVLRYIVADIMVRNGMWEGEAMSMGEITELSFAQEIFNRYNQRGNMDEPATYDIWLNMPTGPAKAVYLRQHPEIQRWVSLGPMANMPSAYQDVVRDIMTRYGQWSEDQTVMGQTLEEFYALPYYAKDQYLDRHPELEAYFSLLRSPEEAAMWRLSTRYFAITDPGARAAFLATYPELREYFVTQRTERYERFMNQVAQYMGANPAMFEMYLERQDDILSELYRLFGELPLLRERYTVSDTTAPTPGTSRSSSGRSRQVS